MVNNSADSVNLIFREQWWGGNCFSTLSGVDLEQKVGQMSKTAQELLHALNESDLNAKFIPNENDRKTIVKVAHSLQVESSWQDVLTNIDYKADNVAYNRLGYILLRVRLLKNPPIAPLEVRPSYLQQIIFLVWNKLTKDYKMNFKFDESTPPYAFSVCTGYSPSTPIIDWTRETINLHKHELGQWAELYSGQFEDYREDVYQKRVENDLSNRQSEIHLIHRNSALIYMEPKNYTAYFIKDADTPDSTNYMYARVINPINKIRTIAFAMIALNSRIDADMKNLVDKDYIKKPVKEIKQDLERTSQLKNMLQILLAPFFTDISRSNRQHYTSVIARAVTLNDIENMWARISQKLEASSHELNAIYNDKQDETEKKQEKALGMVNFILGAGIIFDIIDFIVKGDTTAVTDIKFYIGVVMAVVLVVMLIAYFKNRSKG